MTKLYRPDVVGHRIERIVQAPAVQIDDVIVSTVYVLLELGVLFELVPPGEPPHGPLCNASVNIKNCMDVDFNGAGVCNGELIVEVLESDYWPIIGLLLSSARYLYCDSPSPGVFGVCLSAVAEVYGPSECRSYWPDNFGAS